MGDIRGAGYEVPGYQSLEKLGSKSYNLLPVILWVLEMVQTKIDVCEMDLLIPTVH